MVSTKEDRILEHDNREEIVANGRAKRAKELKSLGNSDALREAANEKMKELKTK
jgi:hypothetical protein